MKTLHKKEIEWYIKNHDRLRQSVGFTTYTGVAYLRKIAGCSYRDLFLIFLVLYYHSMFGITIESGVAYSGIANYSRYFSDYFDSDIKSITITKSIWDNKTICHAIIYFNRSIDNALISLFPKDADSA